MPVRHPSDCDWIYQLANTIKSSLGLTPDNIYGPSGNPKLSELNRMKFSAYVMGMNAGQRYEVVMMTEDATTEETYAAFRALGEMPENLSTVMLYYFSVQAALLLLVMELVMNPGDAQEQANVTS